MPPNHRLGTVERTDFEQWKAREVARLLALVETERRYYQEMVATLPVALVVLAAASGRPTASGLPGRVLGRRAGPLRGPFPAGPPGRAPPRGWRRR